ncbi:MAG: PAS domain S-box protein [Desulfobacteraceae bacterium]|nr:PAS domain S-box protein [Desulfobacteraceae bacterium]
MKPLDKETEKEDPRNIKKSTTQLYQESRLAQKRLNAMLKFLPDPVFVFNLNNTVEYINPAFERVFGWTLKEVKGKNIHFVPDHLIGQAKQGMRLLYQNRLVHDFETQRYTRDGRILDIVINGSILYDEEDKPVGQVLILRDMTVEKRMAKTNQIMFRISKALHSYQKLGDLIALINSEIQKLISVEGAFILLADQKKDQLYFFSAQFRDKESEKLFKKIKFPADQGVTGHVYKTGKPLLIPDVSQCSFFLRRVDEETDMVTKNMLSVPIQLQDRTIGVAAVVNKLHGTFDTTDIELLSMVTSTIALPIENTRINEALRKSYKELKTLNRAKDKVINHLAHELKTPVSVVGASMTLLSKKMNALGINSQPIETILNRGRRNLQRILDIQYEVEDLLRKKEFKAHHLLTRLMDACRDELDSLIALESEDAGLAGKIHRKLETLFAPKDLKSRTLHLDEYLEESLRQLRPEFSHRRLFLGIRIEKTPPVHMPSEILDIVIKGLIRNAVEYTPDAGKIDITLRTTDHQPELIIQDYGIGLTREKRRLILENYFTPPESIHYATKNPYDFNAGGRGFDLLRIKLFSERYPYALRIDSTRCPVIPEDTDLCPGDISLCPACQTPEDCFHSGGTAVRLKFGKA